MKVYTPAGPSTEVPATAQLPMGADASVELKIENVRPGLLVKVNLIAPLPVIVVPVIVGGGGAVGAGEDRT